MPNQCSAEGGCRRAEAVIEVICSSEKMKPETMAAMRMRTSTTSATTDTLCFMNARMMSCVWLPPVSTAAFTSFSSRFLERFVTMRHHAFSMLSRNLGLSRAFTKSSTSMMIM